MSYFKEGKMEVRYWCRQCRKKQIVYRDGKTNKIYCKECDNVLLDGCGMAILYQPIMYCREESHIEGGAWGN